MTTVKLFFLTQFEFFVKEINLQNQNALKILRYLGSMLLSSYSTGAKHAAKDKV